MLPGTMPKSILALGLLDTNLFRRELVPYNNDTSRT